MKALRRIHDELLVLAADLEAEHRIEEAHRARVIARQIDAQDEMIEGGLLP